MPIVRSIFWAMALLLLVACGETGSPEAEIQYAGASPFSDTSVTDVVYCVQNVPQNGQGLDQDDNGVPDLFLFPSACGGTAACGNTKPAGCGFDTTTPATLTLGDIPVDFQYELRAEFRDASGTVLYCGEQSFLNQDANTTITVNMASGACP